MQAQRKVSLSDHGLDTPHTKVLTKPRNDGHHPATKAPDSKPPKVLNHKAAASSKTARTASGAVKSETPPVKAGVSWGWGELTCC